MPNRCAETAVLFCLLPFFIIAETVVLEPGQDKRKAIPIPQEKRTVDLYLTAESPWSIRNSWIEQKDDLSLWMRKNKGHYKLSNAYAPNSFVVIKGELQKPGKRNGKPPAARLSVPSIDLSWDFDCGKAAQENLEHQTPAALLVTTDATRHRNLLVTLREKKNAALVVQLFWTDTQSVRVYRDNIPIWSGSYQTIDGETAFRVEPVAVSASEITFTAKTLPDDYGHTMALDLVKAFTYDLTVEGIKFNHTLNSVRDGVEIRRSYSEAFSIPNGEWTAADGALAPVCYRIGQDITVKAKFRTNSALLSNAGISAIGVESDEGWTFGTFTGRDVTFNGGVSAELEFTMQGTAPSAVGIFEKPRIAWRIQDVNGNGDSALEFARTGPHKAYAILDAPVAPWNGESSGNDQNPWTNALELACSWARGKTTEYEVASQVTHAINETGPFMYDLEKGKHHYLDDDKCVKLSSYMTILNQGIREPPKVNCTDCSNFVVSFSNLLGCRLWSSYMMKSFITRPFIPIGSSTCVPSWRFYAHRVAWTGNCGDDDLVFDACLRYNGAATPTDSFRAELPVGVMFSDGDEGSPFVYRERLCVPGTNGYDRCQARPDFKVRRQVK